METRQGKIEGKELKFAMNKAPYATFTIDGKKYNSFDKEIADNHNPDDLVEFTGEVNVKGFWELKTMRKIDKLTQQPAPAQSQNGDRGFHLSPEEVKCRALEAAIEYCKEVVSYEDLLRMADQFVEWIYGN